VSIPVRLTTTPTQFCGRSWWFICRSDLLDRSITLTLPVILDEERQEEDYLWQRFREVQPRILGALLDAVSAALTNKSKVKLISRPRMADFAG
jgi:hypothetical protein